MTDFTLDTSGEIVLPYPHLHPEPRGYRWSDLDPFTQGYVEALFVSEQNDRGHGISCFSDLSPEALAMILADCAEAQSSPPPWLWPVTGEEFWRARNVVSSIRFPPLTASLGDDGKVRLESHP